MPDSVTAIGQVRCQLGEGPLWSERDDAIYWVDILAPALHRYGLGSRRLSSWAMPEKLGWVVERRDRPGFIAGFQSGFYELTLDPLARRLIVGPEPHLPGNRFNDAKVDASGRLWAGTMDLDGQQPSGSLYCLDRSLTVTRQDSGYLVPNGPAFGKDQECMYHTDSGRNVVYRFELSNGVPRARAEFLRFPPEWGSPDGMTVDCDGGIWIAHWGGGRISRFSEHGVLEHAVSLPASRITSCVFAGLKLDRLFVTSSAADMEHEPFAGALFEVDPGGRRGLPCHLFDG